MTDNLTRRALMKPVQLLGVAFGSALFAFLVAATTMGVFTAQDAAVTAHAWTVALVIGGVVFIAVLLIVAMLLLVVNPADVAKPVDRAVLLPPEDDADSPERAERGLRCAARRATMKR